jgi:hypothetical protein
VDEVLRTVADAMLTTPARHPLAATVREIRDFFNDSHVNAALIVSPAGHLVAVVERDDIAKRERLYQTSTSLRRIRFAGHWLCSTQGA